MRFWRISFMLGYCQKIKHRKRIMFKFRGAVGLIIVLATEVISEGA